MTTLTLVENDVNVTAPNGLYLLRGCAEASGYVHKILITISPSECKMCFELPYHALGRAIDPWLLAILMVHGYGDILSSTRGHVQGTGVESSGTFQIMHKRVHKLQASWMANLRTREAELHVTSADRITELPMYGVAPFFQTLNWGWQGQCPSSRTILTIHGDHYFSFDIEVAVCYRHSREDAGVVWRQVRITLEHQNDRLKVTGVVR